MLKDGYGIIKKSCELCLKMNGTIWAVCKVEDFGDDLEGQKHSEN